MLWRHLDLNVTTEINSIKGTVRNRKGKFFKSVLLATDITQKNMKSFDFKDSYAVLDFKRIISQLNINGNWF